MKTIKQTILGIALSVFSITSVSAQCPSITNMSVTLGSNGTATVTPILSSPVNPAQTMYYWSVTPSATQTSSMYQSNGTFQFPANGSYTLSVFITDSVSGCWLSGNTTLAVSNMSATSCQAAFTTYTDSNCVTHFTNASVGSNLTYEWYDVSNGFSQFSTSTDAVEYFSNGTYLISLYTYSNGSFCDSVTQTITVGCTPSTITCQASFYAYTDSNCVINFVNTSTGINITSSWTINNICYPPSSSNLSIALPAGTYPVVLQTYSNGAFCDSTYQTIIVNCAGGGTTTPTGCQVNSQFYVFADSTNSGNYFAYNLSSGSGALSYLWDFGDGTTSTQQYPFHQYVTPGHYVICLTTTTTYTNALGGTTTCSDTYCDSSSVQRMAAGFLMSQINVIPQSATGIKQAEFVTGLNAYPNPMTDVLTIEVTTKNNSKLNYTLIDALGRVVLTGNIENSKAILNTGSLEKGFYSLSITNEKGSSLKAVKLVK